MTSVKETAARLRECYTNHTPIPAIRGGFGEGDEDVAYDIQAENTRFWVAEGRRLVGRKVGLTSKTVQAQLGVDQPDYGMLFADTDMSGGEIDSSRLIQPRMEAEIAFVLGKDLTEPQLTLADVLSAVDYAVAALEVVDSRIADWDIGIVDTIADNGSSALFVLGPEPVKLTDVDLLGAGMSLTKNGDMASLGTGAACLGHPAYAAKWLAETLARTEFPLYAGDIILTGALGPMVDAVPGDVFEAQIAGVGSVSVRMSQ